MQTVTIYLVMLELPTRHAGYYGPVCLVGLILAKEHGMKLETIWKNLGLPLLLTGVFSAVLALFGVELAQVLVIAGSMLGLQLLISVAIDLLKGSGLVGYGYAGWWSGFLNLFALFGISVLIGLYPDFDFPAVDAQLMDIARFAGLLLTYVIQVKGTQSLHYFNTVTLGVKAFDLDAA